MILFSRYLCNMAKKSNISECLKFDNRVLKALPIDAIESNYVRQVGGACFSLVKPDPIKNPRLIAFSSSALKLLDLDNFTDKENLSELTEYLCGNKLFKDSQPAAHCYCGHQFGNFAGQLGDGAAMYLGEVVNSNGDRWEMQLKGSGKTPYSRNADGRKVLRSSLREFLCSEAMHFLNIPTTRAGSCVTSDTLIERDIFYDGHPIMERCSVVLRISPTFLRFGSFEICKSLDLSTGRSGPSFGKPAILKRMLDYVIESFYPEIWVKRNMDQMTTCYLDFFKEITRRTAVMVAKWQCVGFCHGVLNTDNMSIIGLTIDYGPFGFMDRYDPGFICNATDTGGRYSFENQPSICKWNCLKLAEALKDFIPFNLTKEIVESVFETTYKKEYIQQMSMKIGLKYDESNEVLIESLLETMFTTGADYTNTFLKLEKVVEDFQKNSQGNCNYLIQETASIDELKGAFKPTMSKEDRAFFWRMANNDKDRLIAMGGGFIIDEERKENFLLTMKDWSEDDKKQHDSELWKLWLDKYFIKLQTNSKSFKNIGDACEESLKMMQQTNPRIILRNYLAELSIKAAEKFDFSVCRALLERLENPFSNEKLFHEIELSLPNQMLNVCERPPAWARSLKVT